MRALSCLLLLAGCALAAAATHTLVLVDDHQIKNTHSMFFDSLRTSGHTLHFRDAYEKNSLHQHGEYDYDNIVLFAPTAEDFGGALSTEALVAFIDSGRNILVAANANVTDPVRELANECGVDFDEADSQVIDHVHYDTKDDGDHTLIYSDNLFRQNNAFANKDLKKPILFRGIGHAVNENSPLITAVLRGASTTFSANPNTAVTRYPQSAGQDTLLVSGVQTKNNARVLFSGSLEMFSNKFFSSQVNPAVGSSSESGNREFCTSVAQWTFQQRGVLKAENLVHHQQGNQQKNPSSYRIKDNIEFHIDITEFDGASKGFVADDVQLELVMLDPYIRTTLKHNGKGHFTKQLMLPDVYGIFKFRINYHQPGYSNINLEQQVSIRPFRHNEYERFLACAYPYYSSMFSMMAGFFVFGLLFLYNKSS